MKKIITIIFLLPMAMAEPFEDDPLNLRYGTRDTERLMNTISEFTSMADPQIIINAYDKWNSQNQASAMSSEIINSKNISFSLPAFNNDFQYNILNLNQIYCQFGHSLEISFLGESTNYFIDLQVNIQFLHSGTFLSCEILFNLTLMLDMYVKFEITNLHEIENNNIIRFSEHLYDDDLFDKSIISGEKLCKNVSKEQRQSIFNDTIQAVENKMREWFKSLIESVFQSMSNKCLHARNITYGKKEHYYSRFKSNRNMVAFPWMCDHNELTITGLNKIQTFIVQYSNDLLTAMYKFTFGTFQIQLNTASMFSKRLNIEAPEFAIGGTIRNGMREIKVKSGKTYERSNDYRSINDQEVNQIIDELIQDVIEQTLQNPLSDTLDFAETIGKLLQPFDNKTFMSSFVNPDAAGDNNYHLSTRIPFSNITMEIFRLENTTCLSGDLKIGRLTYKEMKGQVNPILYFAEKHNLYSVPFSGTVCIKEVTIHMRAISNSTNEVVISIDDNINNADATIMVTSNRNRIQPKQRTTIGKQIFEDFVDIIRHKINKAAELTFRPIFNICKDSWNNAVNHRLNFSAIRDYWANATELFSAHLVDISINGFWNFKSINVQYANEKVIVDGLRIENVTGSIKQVYDSGEIVTLNYSISYFTLMINHTDKNVRVGIPTSSKYSIVSIMANITRALSVQETDDVMRKYESSVASFIERLIYDPSDGPDYGEKNRKLVEMAMMEAALNDTTSEEFDASIMFLSDFVKVMATTSLKQSSFMTILPKNYPLNELNLEYIPEHNITIEISLVYPFIYELVRDCSFLQYNHEYFPKSAVSQGAIQMTLKLNGVHRMSAQFPFRLNRYCAMNTSDGNNIEESQINIDDNSTQIVSQQNNSFENGMLEKIIRHYARSFLEYQQIQNFNLYPFTCGPSLFSDMRIEMPFYSINQTIHYSSEHFLTYYIKLYESDCSTSYRLNFSDSGLKFEISATNLTARIIWSYYIADFPLKVPKKMNAKIDKLLLVGKILPGKDRQLIFTNDSQVQLSAGENLMKLEKLKETLPQTILKSVQHTVKVKYLESVSDYSNSGDKKWWNLSKYRP